MTNDSCHGYTAEAAALNIALDIRMSEIRAMQDTGTVTCRVAADMRVEALENHLGRVRELRAAYFPEGGIDE